MLTSALVKKFGEDPKNWPVPGTPIARRGLPEEIGKVVAFLLTDDASFVTASTYSVDGGWAATG